jgi:hypothetical protein
MTLCVPRCTYFPLLPLFIEPIPHSLPEFTNFPLSCIITFSKLLPLEISPEFRDIKNSKNNVKLSVSGYKCSNLQVNS